MFKYEEVWFDHMRVYNRNYLFRIASVIVLGGEWWKQFVFTVFLSSRNDVCD